jgi:hypothetical protein
MSVELLTNVLATWCSVGFVKMNMNKITILSCRSINSKYVGEPLHTLISNAIIENMVSVKNMRENTPLSKPSAYGDPIKMLEILLYQSLIL